MHRVKNVIQISKIAFRWDYIINVDVHAICRFSRLRDQWDKYKGHVNIKEFYQTTDKTYNDKLNNLHLILNYWSAMITTNANKEEKEEEQNKTKKKTSMKAITTTISAIRIRV